MNKRRITFSRPKYRSFSGTFAPRAFSSLDPVSPILNYQWLFVSVDQVVTKKYPRVRHIATRPKWDIRLQKRIDRNFKMRPISVCWPISIRPKTNCARAVFGPHYPPMNKMHLDPWFPYLLVPNFTSFEFHPRVKLYPGVFIWFLLFSFILTQASFAWPGMASKERSKSPNPSSPSLSSYSSITKASKKGSPATNRKSVKVDVPASFTIDVNQITSAKNKLKNVGKGVSLHYFTCIFITMHADNINSNQVKLIFYSCHRGRECRATTIYHYHRVSREARPSSYLIIWVLGTEVVCFKRRQTLYIPKCKGILILPS